jgi:hypothetical protein
MRVALVEKLEIFGKKTPGGRQYLRNLEVGKI